MITVRTQMDMVDTRPIFVRASIQFKIQGKEYSFLNQYVSTFGVAGIRWPYFDPTEHVGEEVNVVVNVLAREKFQIRTRGSVISEQTKDALYLGIRFYLSDMDKVKLSRTIKKDGSYPTAYIRKYPRIPASETLKNMPLRAIIQVEDGELISFDIANLSPNGVLLKTENPRSGLLIPGERIECQVDPRGNVYDSFDFKGTICRVMEEKAEKTGNLTRYFGIKITKLKAQDREHFVNILKAILANIKKPQAY